MNGLHITLLCIPAHIGVKGNEIVDKWAKKAKNNNTVDITVPYSKTEMKSMIKHKLRERWQKQWEEEITGRWFYKI